MTLGPHRAPAAAARAPSIPPPELAARRRETRYPGRMQLALKIRVEGGRIKVDEPTNLPEGSEVELLIVGGDDLDDDERAALHASLDRALDDEDAGRVVDTDEFLTEVRRAT